MTFPNDVLVVYQLCLLPTPEYLDCSICYIEMFEDKAQDHIFQAFGIERCQSET